MTRWERLLSASSFACLIGAGMLIYSVYTNRAAGLSGYNVVRCLTAGGLVGLAVKGTRLRHAAPREPDGPLK